MSSRVYLNEHRNNQLFPKALPSRLPQVRDFHKTLPHYASAPLISLPGIAESLGIAHVLLKDESTRLGLTAFKILGASWATYRALVKKLHLQPLDDKSVIPLGVLASAAQEAKIVLYAATDGNHGRAVARMAQYLGISAKIFVPTMVDEEAKSKIANEGADVEVFDGDYDGTVLHTKEATENHPCGKGLLISDTSLEVGEEVPSWIVEGYQTMFDEIEEQVLAVTRKNTITHVVTPVGVGSLAQAVVTHFRRTPRLERVSIIAVEPVAAACLKASLEAGTMKSVETGYTICTGMCCGTLSVSGWPILRDGVDITVAVEDREVHNAVGELESSDIWVGPCGAACLAGLLNLAKSGVIPRDGKAVVVLLCTEGKRGYKLELGV